jgi:hypothetical protein
MCKLNYYSFIFIGTQFIWKIALIHAHYLMVLCFFQIKQPVTFSCSLHYENKPYTMKNIFLSSLCILFSFALFGGIPFEKCSEKPSFQTFYDGYLHPEDKLFIETGYTAAELVSAEQISMLKNSDIYAIDLVYSNYPEGGIYSGLNHARLHALDKALPFLKRREGINWRFIAVGKNLNENSAKSLFHGFVITFRKKASMADMLLSCEQLKNLDLDTYDSTSVEYKQNIMTKIFNRKKWADAAFAVDITGSMYPYIKELLIWVYVTNLEQDNAEFLFFNDGDQTPDGAKTIGKTGGFYSCKNGASDMVIDTIVSGMSKGNGGDCPENNIEAILAIQKKQPKVKEIVMVADNWAPIKDKELIKKVNKPIRIILCGVNGNSIHPDYLNLALQTGGSVHTIEKDIENLKDVKKGEVIKVLQKNYRLTEHGFVFEE